MMIFVPLQILTVLKNPHIIHAKAIRVPIVKKDLVPNMKCQAMKILLGFNVVFMKILLVQLL